MVTIHTYHHQSLPQIKPVVYLLVTTMVVCPLQVLGNQSQALESLKLLVTVAGGDNWAKKHEKLHRSTLYVRLRPQTEKYQSVTPQTTKYRYRTVTF